METKSMDSYDKQLDILMKMGWLVHPIDVGVWGVFSSPEKIEKRFKSLKEYYPNASIQESENLAEGDYIINLYEESKIVMIFNFLKNEVKQWMKM